MIKHHTEDLGRVIGEGQGGIALTGQLSPSRAFYVLTFTKTLPDGSKRKLDFPLPHNETWRLLTILKVLADEGAPFHPGPKIPKALCLEDEKVQQALQVIDSLQPPNDPGPAQKTG